MEIKIVITLLCSTKSTDDSSSKKKSPKQPVPPEDIYQKVNILRVYCYSVMNNMLPHKKLTTINDK